MVQVNKFSGMLRAVADGKLVVKKKDGKEEKVESKA